MSTEYKIKLELNLTIIPTTGETIQSLAETTDQPLRAGPHKPKRGNDQADSLAETTNQPLTGTHEPKPGEGPFKSLADTTDQP
jgi:hypothetical protein